MPAEFESIGLKDFLEDEDIIQGWVGHSIENGRVFEGYSGNSYISSVYGDVEIYSCIIKDEETDENELERFDIQVSEPCVWKVRCSVIDLPSVTACDMTRLIMVNSTENESFTVMHILNADVLPSFLEGDEIVAQVVAYALDVHYYKDEDAFSDTIPECEGMKCEELNGHKLIPEMGTVFPNGFLHGHVLKEGDDLEGYEEDNSNNDLVLITGIVKRAYVESVKINDEVISKFIISQIETHFGDLEIVHSRSMISDEEAQLIQKGAVVQAVAVLSGDVAIDDYHNGIVKNEENDLAALRYAIEMGNATRLHSILADDAVYDSVNWENSIIGKQNIIDCIDYVHDNTAIKYHSFLGFIDGKRCIVLTEEGEGHCASMVRIDVNDEGMITKILVTDAPDTFHISKQESGAETVTTSAGGEKRKPCETKDAMDILREMIIKIPRDFAAIEKLLATAHLSSKELAELSVIVTADCEGELTWPEEDPKEIDPSQLSGTYLIDTLKLLLKYGFNPNDDFEGELAMFNVQYIGTPNVGPAALRLLLEHGGDPNIQLPDDPETLFEDLDFKVGDEDFELGYRLQCLMVLTAFGGCHPHGSTPFIMLGGHKVTELREFENYFFEVEKVPTDKNSYPDSKAHIYDKTTKEEVALSWVLHHD